MDTIKFSGLGTVCRLLSQGRLCEYQEYRENFQVPERYLSNVSKSVESIANSNETPYDNNDKTKDEEKEFSSPVTFKYSDNNDSTIIVEWYSDDDPENPQNWSKFKKGWVMISMSILTIFIYLGSSIQTPGVQEIAEEFNSSERMAILPLTVFVLGYAIGPMVLSPLTEHPPIGRSPVYLITLIIFVLIQIPTALSTSINELIGLRFLAGVCASPALSTGGATVGDVFSVKKIYLGVLFWALAACCGPTLGPLLGGIVIQLINWRWAFWLLMILSGSAFLVLFCFFPETNASTLLHKRAKRLRKVTGNNNIMSRYEVDCIENPKSFKTVIIDILWRPIFIAFHEPIVFFINLYCAFIYIIVNSWFEAFPIVFNEIYHFNKIESGLTYLDAAVGSLIGAGLHLIIFHKQIINSKGHVEIERYLISALYGSFFLPIGLFIFCWTSTESIHWIVPIIGATIFFVGAIMTFQANFNYLSLAFPRYLASVFAGNCLFRAGLACPFPLFVSNLFTNLRGTSRFPIGAGGSVLGAIGAVMILIPFAFYRYGVKIRGRSKFAN